MDEAIAVTAVDRDADAEMVGDAELACNDVEDVIEPSGIHERGDVSGGDITRGAVANDIELSDHVGLVHRVARRYVGLGVEYDDLVQAGMMGALRAMKTYDPARGRFSTYATPWIRQSIVREIQNHSRTIRVPVHQQFTLYRDGKLTTEKLARLDAPLSDGDTTLYDFLGKTDDPTARLARTEAHERVAAAITELNEKQRAVVQWRFGEEELTLTEIGSRLGVSRARARQIEESALRALQRELKKPANTDAELDAWDEPEGAYWPQYGG
jgi:RNA polymerase sigma factor (sigma-70 family)